MYDTQRIPNVPDLKWKCAVTIFSRNELVFAEIGIWVGSVTWGYR